MCHMHHRSKKLVNSEYGVSTEISSMRLLLTGGHNTRTNRQDEKLTKPYEHFSLRFEGLTAGITDSGFSPTRKARPESRL